MFDSVFLRYKVSGGFLWGRCRGVGHLGGLRGVGPRRACLIVVGFLVPVE